jgi:UDP-4-amino-4,6-dideoxy-N-acetyl-beta-L-altrosamine N-acetyltransferase
LTRADILSGFGVTLRRLTREDLELVRGWRNDPAVSQFMLFRDRITPDMQERWFESIDNDANFYFVIEHRGRKVGLSNIKDVDWHARRGEGGIFVVPEELRTSLLPYQASLVASDYVFFVLELELVTATYTKENRRAMRFNRGLGHVLDPEVPGVARTSRLTRQAYERARPALVSVVGGHDRS